MTNRNGTLNSLLFPWENTEQLPISFRCGGKTVRGIPAAWKPVVTVRSVDCNITDTTVEGVSSEGLAVRMVCRTYHDFAAAEYSAWLTNWEPTTIR